MKTLVEWLDEYGQSHRNPVNKTVHWICVPLITFSVLGLLWAVSPWLAVALVALATVFYLRLSPALALGMLPLAALMLAAASVIPNLVWSCASIFVLAWIGQFWGHKVEGRKPSFFKDVQFLLIGPLWLLSFVYRRAGLRI
jgi:uncharacterized membrane protein YGL010W